MRQEGESAQNTATITTTHQEAGQDAAGVTEDAQLRRRLVPEKASEPQLRGESIDVLLL